MDDECSELQRSEMDALTAIYGENGLFEYSFSDGQVSGKATIEIDSNCVQELVQPASESSPEYLPPITLIFSLPTRYPLIDPPTVNIECCWLDDAGKSAVITRLAEIWELERGMGVLHSFIDALGHDLHLISRITVDLENSIDAVISYITERRRRDFEARSYTCAICIEEQSGKHCIQLSCSHVFCRKCLSSYLSILVTEGNISQLKCPDTQCHGSSTQPAITDMEMQQLLSREQISRIHRLREQRRIDNDKTKYAWCPRTGCGLGVECDKTVESLCECSCGYVFCKLCLRTWHGTNYCEIKSTKKIVNMYIKAVRESEDPMMRIKMEKQYGKTALQRMLAMYDRDNASLKLIRESTQKCPKCDLRIQKAYGCNHMQCTQCNAHFCYLCGEVVDRINPMHHFNSANSLCNKRLFDGIEGSGGHHQRQQQEAEDEELNLMIRLAFEDDHD
ncbi:hypothetical protein FB645_001764 [Coemansia sp. IMI 203386]|nr:hypothetical protein FB645_001764 [Coemansia sp. IMI 203386]